MGVVVCTWTISHWKWKLFVLPSEFWISIHNERKRPVLDNNDNEVVRISLNSFDLLLKVNESLYIALLVVSQCIYYKAFLKGTLLQILKSPYKNIKIIHIKIIL